MIDPSSPLNEKNRIDIILEEYKALRAEILVRTTMQCQLYTAIGAVLVTIVGLTVSYSLFLAGPLMFLFAVGIFAGGVLLLDNDLRNVGRRLEEIEAEINRRAGEPLLIWETRFGLNNVGYNVRTKAIATRLRISKPT